MTRPCTGDGSFYLQEENNKMEKLGLNQIRSMFLDFFESKGHLKHESFSLVPEKDKSLILINSGMAPLKPYFAGLETPPRKRMTTSPASFPISS